MECGIAPYGNNIVVLSYDEQDSILSLYRR